MPREKLVRFLPTNDISVIRALANIHFGAVKWAWLVGVFPPTIENNLNPDRSKNMKMKQTLASLAIVAVLVVGCASEKSQAELQAKTKITQAQAQQTALARAPGGSVKTSELEEEKGKLVWSLDIATPGTKDITEVLVDAINGEVVSVEKETPKQQEKEAKQDQKGR